MKRKTYKQLESDLLTSQIDAGNMHCAINDLLNHKQTWFRCGKTRIGVSRETGPEGGLVIHRQMQEDGSSSSCVYLWENWFPQVRDSIPARNDKEALDLREAALAAHVHMMKMQNQ